MDINEFADKVVSEARGEIDRSALIKRLEAAKERKRLRLERVSAEREERKVRAKREREARYGEIRTGLDFIKGKEERFYMITCVVSGYKIGVGVFDVYGDGKKYVGGACFCAPSDRWGDRAAIGLIVKRILHAPIFDHEFGKKTGYKVAIRMALFRLMLKCHAGEKKIPEKVTRECRRAEFFNVDLSREFSQEISNEAVSIL